MGLREPMTKADLGPTAKFLTLYLAEAQINLTASLRARTRRLRDQNQATRALSTPRSKPQSHP